MPTGKKVSDEKKAVIMRLHHKGVTPQQIAPQVGLHWCGVYKLIRRELKNPSQNTQKGGSRNGESKTGNNGGPG